MCEHGVWRCKVWHGGILAFLPALINAVTLVAVASLYAMLAVGGLSGSLRRGSACGESCLRVPNGEGLSQQICSLPVLQICFPHKDKGEH